MMECWERAQGGDWDEGQVEERERFHGEEERALVAEAVVREVEEVEREVEGRMVWEKVKAGVEGDEWKVQAQRG